MANFIMFDSQLVIDNTPPPLPQIEYYFFNFVTIGQGKSRGQGAGKVGALGPRNGRLGKVVSAGLEAHPYGQINSLQKGSYITGVNQQWSVPEEGSIPCVSAGSQSEVDSDVQLQQQVLVEQKINNNQKNINQTGDSEDVELGAIVPTTQSFSRCSRGDSPYMVAPRLATFSRRKGTPRQSPRDSPGPVQRPRISSSFTFGGQGTGEQSATMSASAKSFGNEYVSRRSSSAFRRMSRSSSAGNNFRSSQEYGVLLGDKWVNGVGGSATPQSHGSVSRGSSFGNQNSIISTGSQEDDSLQRVLSTRDRYNSGKEDFMASGGDPAEQMKQQLESLFVNHPEIANRIHDGICDDTNVDGFASHTKQLHLRWDVSGAMCINQYILIKKLAEGAFGKVKLCYNTVDKELYAVKVLYRKNLNKSLNKRHSLRRKNQRLNVVQDPAMQNILREIAVLKKLEHPNVVKLKEVIDPPDFDDPLMLVMDYLEGGHVVNRISGTDDRFDQLYEDEAREYFRMMCKGLDYLHYNRVVHGDLKPENLLLDGKGELKIADFGCARIKDVDYMGSSTSRYGTPAFRAPEMLTGDNYDPFTADIWALGVCLYCMVFGQLPFSGSILEMYDNIKQQQLTFPTDIQASRELKDLLTKILHKDPMRRALLFDIMSHNWVTEYGQCRLVPILELTRPPNRVQVSMNEQLSAIKEEDYLLKPQFKDISFQDGEYLIKSGDTSSVMYFILSGAVELRDPVGSGNNKKRTSLTLNPTDALTFQTSLDDANVVEQLHLNVQQTEEVTRRIHESTQDRYKEVLLEVKGPANIIGDISICHPVRPYTYNAVARGNVIALELTQDMLNEFLSHIYKQDSQQMQKAQKASNESVKQPPKQQLQRNVSFSINA